jgi:hypothetical protein
MFFYYFDGIVAVRTTYPQKGAAIPLRLELASVLLRPRECAHIEPIVWLVLSLLISCVFFLPLSTALTFKSLHWSIL